MNEQQRELRDAIRAQINDGMSADDVANKIALMFYDVEDDWVEHDVSTYGRDDRQIQRERSLVGRWHRETVVVSVPYPNRLAGLDSPQP
jgi:hypothetical protein